MSQVGCIPLSKDDLRLWRRSSSPAFLFDQAQRRICEVRQRLTNTPLQALTLLNDESVLEASQFLSAQCLRNYATREGIEWMAVRILGRPLADEEWTLIHQQYQDVHDAFSQRPHDAKAYSQSVNSSDVHWILLTTRRSCGLPTCCIILIGMTMNDTNSLTETLGLDVTADTFWGALGWGLVIALSMMRQQIKAQDHGGTHSHPAVGHTCTPSVIFLTQSGGLKSNSMTTSPAWSWAERAPERAAGTTVDHHDRQSKAIDHACPNDF